MPLPEDAETFLRQKVPRMLEKRPALKARLLALGATAQVELVGDDGGVWNLTVREDRLDVGVGPLELPMLSITMTVDTWCALLERKLDPKMAVVQGRVKLRGRVAMAMRLLGQFLGGRNNVVS